MQSFSLIYQPDSIVDSAVAASQLIEGDVVEGVEVEVEGRG